MNPPAKTSCLFLATALVLPLLASCSLPGAAWRSVSSLLAMSASPADPAAQQTAFDGLREIQAAQEEESLTPPAADSTR
jgi:hypothetical protein